MPSLHSLIHSVYCVRTEGIVQKKLTKHGNSLALVIDKPVLELLRAGPDTTFDIVTDGSSLVLTPVRPAGEQKKFEEALEMVHRRFGNALKKLAE